MALVAINALFLAIIVIDTYADARSERRAIENVCAILKSNGIDIDSDAIDTNYTLRTMRTARGIEMEASVAVAVLGPVEMTDQGIIYQYENQERGTAQFSSAGEFEIWLNEGVITSDDGTVRAVKELLRKMKIETSGIEEKPGSGGDTVKAVSAYKGASIFNGTIDFIFSDGSLNTIIGRYVTGIEPAEDGVNISHVETALLGFLAAVKKGDVECSKIQSVEAGYQYSVVGSFGDGEIAPVWMITTNEGRFIVDSATGEIRPV